MEKEKSSIQKLNEFAEQTNRLITFTDKLYPSNAIHPVTYRRRTLYIPNNKGRSSYFVCFDDSRRMNRYARYSGVFFPIELSKSTKICIRKKDIVDKLNFFTKTNRCKIGQESFDSHVIYEEFDSIRNNQIFTNTKIQDLIRKAFVLKLRVGVNMLLVDFVPGFRKQSYFGIYTTHEWLTNPMRIEFLFDLAEEINRNINSMQEALEMAEL
ncbi:hypothetical protein [Ancylomarina longa]|uniref:Uncharacterized protein n=1 Tax=Ancylomarina longa TaxID=2487017 RepID=A0A434AUP4_9BACT|nr:hypothetical protein [Ancylomarina longa]RUT78172.1 hypothetical protein DLK05_10020 [Ancylomarina longa]